MKQRSSRDVADISKKKSAFKNRADPEIEKAVVEHVIEQPAWGRVRISNELHRRGKFILPVGVRRGWLRHDLNFLETLRGECRSRRNRFDRLSTGCFGMWPNKKNRRNFKS